MNTKIVIGSFLAAVLIVLLPVSSVVGTQNEKEGTSSNRSPLFAVRQQGQQAVRTTYLGKESCLSLFSTKTLNYGESFERAVSMLRKNPGIYSSIVEKLQRHPKVLEFINSQDIDSNDFQTYANRMKYNPELLEEEIAKVQAYIPEDTPLPLGLNETNPIAILILIIALLPILLMLTIVIATATILTCLNLGGCFENLFEQLVTNFFMGLTQPE